MWFESLLVFILFKFKKRPNISGIQVVYYICEWADSPHISSFRSIQIQEHRLQFHKMLRVYMIYNSAELFSNYSVQFNAE